jgi:hypothetical protein
MERRCGMIKHYRCTKTFEVEEYDDNGYSTDRYITVKRGEAFDYDTENTFHMVGTPEYCLLISRNRAANNGRWLDLSKDMIEEYFIELKGGAE